MSESTYGAGSSFGFDADVPSGETSHEADIKAGNDDGDAGRVGTADAGEAVADSHAADVEAGYDDGRGDEDATDDRV